jgi:GNAT superfamily N-acetyltransferase
MHDHARSSDAVELPDTVPVEGLAFRRLRVESDYPRMAAVSKGMREVDQLEFTLSSEDLAREFRFQKDFDPARDVLIAELDTQVVGWSRVWQSEDPAGLQLYNHFVDLLPALYGKGVRNMILRYNERRLREIAREHPTPRPRLFQSTASDPEQDWISVLKSEGYAVYRYGYQMIRPNLDDVPDMPLPERVEIRPVESMHYRKIIDAWNEACKDMRGQIPISDEDFKSFQESPIFDQTLWQIAWHRDEVVGTTLNWINSKENMEYRRKRGSVELISVRRQWRGKGIAKALIARSLNLLKSRGMTEAALGVDAENPSGALHLYLKMGFEIRKRGGIYRKPMDAT